MKHKIIKKSENKTGNIAKLMIIDKKVVENFKSYCKNRGFIMQKRLEILMIEDMKSKNIGEKEK